MTHTLVAQVGIGTETPRTKLEVAGDMKIVADIAIGTINKITDDDSSTFLIQDDTDKIKALDVSHPTGAALGYIQEYIIRNPNEDWILNFDTGVNANNFVLNTISAYYDRELDIGSESSIPYTSAYISGGTWHIIADFPSANNLNGNEIGTWTITTLIYSQDLSKQFGSIVIPMAGGTTGTATNPVIN
ncbi:hypothetical protein ACH3O9_15080 [Leeuwenhoekiella sp. A16]|uniref:hypothetical protein n=1 Tax=unclassified Leeuwenhoekiella TaxID=2615029 RepID=UPI003A8067E6